MSGAVRPQLPGMAAIRAWTSRNARVTPHAKIATADSTKMTGSASHSSARRATVARSVARSNLTVMASTAGRCHVLVACYCQRHWPGGQALMDCQWPTPQACKACPDQNEMESATHCSSCNNGYHVHDKTCMVFDCLRTVGTGCADCVDIPERVSDATCQTWPASQELSTISF